MYHRTTFYLEASCKLHLLFQLFHNDNFQHSDPKDQVWIWYNEGERFYYDKTEWVRVRIEQEHWHEASPTEPGKHEETALSERHSPYSITASMKESGLGVVTWW